jgi:hypothetical protein
LFEIELAKISQARENRRNATRMYNPMRVGDLATLAPIIPWVDYINNILTDKIIQVNMHSPFLNPNPHCFIAITKATVCG